MPKRLTDQYTWQEIGKLFADRIEKNEFINKKDWSRKIFLSWFKEREKIGILFDWQMVARAFTIWNQLRKESDHFTVIVGTEGTGKTTLAIQLGAWVSPNMDKDDICFNVEHYVKKMKAITSEYKKNKLDQNDKTVIIDEGGISLFSREALSKSNIVLSKMFMVQRFLNVNVEICIPHYWSLDTLIRNHRINTLIIVKRRAHYKAVVGKGIKILNRIAKKDKEKELCAFPIPYGYFWDGKFGKDFPKTISKKQYEAHKFKHIKNFIGEVELDAQSFNMISIAKVEKDFGIEKADIIKEIQNGNIEGKKVGNKWFLTSKGYKKLVSA